MIIENVNVKLSRTLVRNHIDNGIILDSHVLLVLIVDLYVREHKNKKYILKQCNVTQSQINCLNHLLTAYKIKTLIITPYIFAEFLNRIRKDLKEDYKIIKKEFLTQLLALREIQIEKNIILQHANFVDFGNDISLLEAVEEQSKSNKYTSIASFDGRFVNSFFGKKENVLAFNLNVLQHYYI